MNDYFSNNCSRIILPSSKILFYFWSTATDLYFSVHYDKTLLMLSEIKIGEQVTVGKPGEIGVFLSSLNALFVSFFEFSAL